MASHAGRPRTRAASTARPRTSVGADDASWICAVWEGRGVGREVGIAACNRSTASVVLTQLSDSQTYVKTLHSLHQRPPSHILVPQSALEPSKKQDAAKEPTLLVRILQDAFEDAMVVGVKRKYWSEEDGADNIERLALEDDRKAATIHAAEKKFYALGACSALFKYLETSCQISYPSRTVRIDYCALEGTMLIDPETAVNLELVANILNRHSKHSLYGLLNHCITPMAARLLRVNILAPLTDAETISTRLDAVQELVQSDDRLDVIRRALAPFKGIDFDKLVGSLVTKSTAAFGTLEPAVEAERKAAQLLQPRTLVRHLPPLRTALEACHSSLLRQINRILCDTRPDDMRTVIDDTINEEALQGLKKGSFGNKASKVYAVKAKEKRMLDVTRAAYEENIRDAEELQKQLVEETGLDIQLKHQASGFVLHVKKAEVANMAWPRTFTSRAVKGDHIQFSTLELAKTNDRIRSSQEEIFILSNESLEDVLDEIRDNVACLFQVCEAIAVLDMLCSFAKAAQIGGYTRPEFTETLAIKSGRHPIQEHFSVAKQEGFTPNDTYADELARFQIITGANGSGKSTLLRQIALLVVMAQIGSFVPAEYASFPVNDALFSRLSNDDSIEANLSTFAMEMQTMSAILSALPSFESVLVIVDELGRGTSPLEGAGIAHAIAEEIIREEAICFFATHFKELTTTLSKYPTVISLHLDSDTTRGDGPEQGQLYHHHRLVDGASSLPHYGLAMAHSVGLPHDMLVSAWSASKKLERLQKADKASSAGERLRQRRILLKETDVLLKQTYRSSNLDNDALRDYLKAIQVDALKNVVATLAPLQHTD